MSDEFRIGFGKASKAEVNQALSEVSWLERRGLETYVVPEDPASHGRLGAAPGDPHAWPSAVLELYDGYLYLCSNLGPQLAERLLAELSPSLPGLTIEDWE